MNEELELEKLNDLAIHYPVYLIDAAAEHFNGDECKLEAIAVVLSGLDALCIRTGTQHDPQRSGSNFCATVGG